MPDLAKLIERLNDKTKIIISSLTYKQITKALVIRVSSISLNTVRMSSIYVSVLIVII